MSKLMGKNIPANFVTSQTKRSYDMKNIIFDHLHIEFMTTQFNNIQYKEIYLDSQEYSKSGTFNNTESS